MTEQQTNQRASIIETVQTPLGFFTLGVLVCEAIMSVVVFKLTGTNQTILIVGMIGILVFLVAIVSFISFVRPEALKYGQDEIIPEEVRILLPNARTFLARSEAIVGCWSMIGKQVTDAGETVTESTAKCTISRSGLQVTIEGTWRTEDGAQAGAWIAENVFLGEHELTYVWRVPSKIGAAPTGLASLIYSRLPNTRYVNEMKGNWGVVGRGEYGTLELRRTADSDDQ